MKISRILKNLTDNKKSYNKKLTWKEYHHFRDKCKENHKNREEETH